QKTKNSNKWKRQRIKNDGSTSTFAAFGTVLVSFTAALGFAEDLRLFPCLALVFFLIILA
ncbi:hypothetical protein OFN49_27045, partial [Escherichia coli]|nr:hypothetical protein [Escherichia coli]